MSVYSIDELRVIVGDVACRYGVKKVALFGSYSTGTQTPESDIDLLIDKGELKGLFMFNSFVNTLRERLDRNVDVITYSTLERSLIRDSVKNEVVLYEQ
ncbi:MAG: nucleotidyltransferase domain-containing protein [Oscillospiraceae bacterium]|nr:nucleotidyltransferase [Oscillospiraceae bacterium]MBQ6845980.1 nucleotidyltransferase domain-containing protein [Oscillospiraceae bacterium]MBQ7119977.1 nucleotidyltransferase domain-containing protein [Oscillospiraceae bacterium]